MIKSLLGICIICCLGFIVAPLLCAAQDDSELREQLRTKQLAGGYAEECEGLIEDGAFEEARESCRQAYEIRPRDLRSAWNLGVSFLSGGDLERARPYFEKIQTWMLDTPGPGFTEEEFRSAFESFFVHLNTLAQQDKSLEAAQYAHNWGQRLGELGSHEMDVDDLLGVAGKSREDGDRSGNTTFYLQAIQFYEQALTLETQSLIPRQGVLLQALKGLGNCAAKLERHSQAFDAYKQALKLTSVRDSLEDRADIQQALGRLYMAVDRYDDAIDAYQEAAELYRNLDQPIERIIALNNIGIAYQSLAEYDRALAYYQEALVLAEEIGSTEDIIIESENLGLVYEIWGLYDKAIELYRQALEYERQSERKLEISRHLRAIGRVYEIQADYPKALSSYQEALELDRAQVGVESYADIAFGLETVGNAYRALGQDDDAQEQYALGITYWEAYQRNVESWKQSPDDARYTAHLAASFNNIGTLYLALKSYAQAIASYQQAVELNRGAGYLVDMALNVWNIGNCYHDWDKGEQAIASYHQALALYREAGRKDEEGILLHSIATIYFDSANYSEAIPFLEASVEISEELRKTAVPEARRDYFAKLIETYRYLISAYLRIGDLEGAFRIIELSRAKQLSEQLKQEAPSEATIPTLAQLQTTMPEESAMLLYARGADDHLVRLLMTHGEASAIERPLTDFMTSLPDAIASDRPDSAGVDDSSRGLGIAGVPAAEDSQESPAIDYNELSTFQELVQYYRALLQDPDGSESFTALARHFYELLVADIQPALQEKRTLLILPDGALNFLPFETFIDRDERYLAESFNIRYAHSNSVLESIEQRRYDANRQLLAFGGAVYDVSSYQDEVVESSVRFAELQQRVDSAIRQSSTRAIYADLGKTAWGNLPGTLAEVRALEDIFDDATIVSGFDVNEKRVKSLSQSGRLTAYRIIHFATHGDANLLIPELSALVLSLPQEAQNDDSGFLRAGEIVELDLQADLVTLSACETGLGKFYAGEGIVGLAQAFLVAGANSVSVSLWQVADESTALFMPTVYRLLQEEELSYVEAFTEVKRLFIRGAFGEAWKAPYYWAPFVYYGL